MEIEGPERAKDQRPFQSFEIRTADGRAITVRHPDTLAWDPESPRIAICLIEGGGWEIIDVAPIASLGIPAPKPPVGGPLAADRGS